MSTRTHPHHEGNSSNRSGKQLLISAEQVVVKGEFTKILLEYSKRIIKESPRNILTFSREYFEQKLN